MRSVCDVALCGWASRCCSSVAALLQLYCSCGRGLAAAAAAAANAAEVFDLQYLYICTSKQVLLY